MPRLYDENKANVRHLFYDRNTSRAKMAVSEQNTMSKNDHIRRRYGNRFGRLGNRVEKYIA